MTVTLHGFPWDAGSSYARGAAHGPAMIRSVLFSEASSPYSLSGEDVLSGMDAGKIIGRYDFEPLPSDGEMARQAIADRIAATLAKGAEPLSLGGDHSITYPILKAIRDRHGPVNILHVDAHTDLYEEFDGDRFSHA